MIDTQVRSAYCASGERSVERHSNLWVAEIDVRRFVINDEWERYRKLTTEHRSSFLRLHLLEVCIDEFISRIVVALFALLDAFPHEC